MQSFSTIPKSKSIFVPIIDNSILFFCISKYSRLIRSYCIMSCVHSTY